MAWERIVSASGRKTQVGDSYVSQTDYGVWRCRPILRLDYQIDNFEIVTEEKQTREALSGKEDDE